MPLLLENPGLYNSFEIAPLFGAGKQTERGSLQKDMASRRGANSFLSAGLPFVTFIVGGSYMLSEVGPTRTGEVQPPDDKRQVHFARRHAVREQRKRCCVPFSQPVSVRVWCAQCIRTMFKASNTFSFILG